MTNKKLDKKIKTKIKNILKDIDLDETNGVDLNNLKNKILDNDFNKFNYFENIENIFINNLEEEGFLLNNNYINYSYKIFENKINNLIYNVKKGVL